MLHARVHVYVLGFCSEACPGPGEGRVTRDTARYNVVALPGGDTGVLQPCELHHCSGHWLVLSTPRLQFLQRSRLVNYYCEMKERVITSGSLTLLTHAF